jgi:SAM-dependent methyltransferase
VLHAHGLAASLAQVLDLGCGPGRVATWFKREFAHVQLTGCDIDAQAIAWAQANLPEVARFVCNTSEPPTPMPDAGFDLVYSVSLFTHLDERMQDAWLAEIARLLKPGGHLLATTHGEHAAASCTPSERREVARRGIAFRVDRRGRFKLDGLPDFYQTTFHSETYVRAHWSRFLDVVEFLPGGLGGHQDLVLLRRRG